MSRCKACNDVLNDEELTRKWPPTEEGKVEYVDLCNKCYCAALEVEEDENLFDELALENLANYGLED